MIPEPLRGLCNLPDLILLGFLLFSAVMGASRGPTRTLLSLLARLGSLLAAFNVEGMASGEVADALNADNVAVRGGLHCAPGAHQLLGTLETGAVRASPGPFNTERDVDLLLTSVERIAARRA